MDPFDLNICTDHLNQSISIALFSTFHLYTPILNFNTSLQAEFARNSKLVIKEDGQLTDKQNPLIFQLNTVSSKSKMNNMFENPISLNLSSITQCDGIY